MWEHTVNVPEQPLDTRGRRRSSFLSELFISIGKILLKATTFEFLVLDRGAVLHLE